MSTRQKKPDVPINSVKDVVKKFKNQGFAQLTNFQLAIALVTIGFKQACQQFGAKWTSQNEKQALKTLAKSDYDISWYGKVNSLRFGQILPLTLRGDIQKIKDIIRTTSKQSKSELLTTTDNFKRTALHLAVKENFDVLAEFLINQGFSLTARDRELKTPLHYCRSQLVCQILLKKGANAVVKDNKLCTPAHHAAALQDSKVLQILLKSGNVVNHADYLKKTPIFYAIFNTSAQQVNILRVLVEHGANVNEKDVDGRTPLHYAAQSGKTRCIPYLLQKGASIQVRDKRNQTPLDLALNEKVKKLLLSYTETKGIILETQQKQKRDEYSRIESINSKKDGQSSIKSKDDQTSGKTNTQIFTKQLNQVSTWIRQKFFVLMKKLQESGVKANWHMKRPYIYTGSWAEDVESLEDLYQSFLDVTGPQAAMRAFNILCPYEKPLPKVIGKAQQAFQSFFGQSWFSTDPIQKIRNLKSQSKIRTELQIKTKQAQDLKTQLLGYRSQTQRLEGQIAQLQSSLRRYEKIQEDFRKERTKNTQQYSQILQLMGQKEELRAEIENLISGEERTKVLSDMVQDLKQKNHSFELQIQSMKAQQAAARRKCGQIFLKSLSQAQAGQSSFKVEQNNLFDDDAIINLYQLLKESPSNLEKRFRKSDRRGKGKLTVEQFTEMLQELSMLPQDVMSMHRITSFAYGRKDLSFDEFKTILQNRHKNRPMWQKKLVKKMKEIITSSNLSIEKFFSIIDKDGNGTIEAQQLRKGLQSYNIYMNHTDWCNLFSLLDSDKSGEIDLNELRTLMSQEKTGKLDNVSGIEKIGEEEEQKEENEAEQPQEPQEPQENHEEQQEEQANDEQQPKDEEQNAQQEQNKSEKQSYVSRQQLGKEILDDQSQFSQQYVQKDSDIENGIQTINGVIKLQLTKISFPSNQTQQFGTVYAKFQQDDRQQKKLIDLSEQKQKIAVDFEFIEYKIQNREDFVLYVSLWKQMEDEEMTKENYLGEVKVPLEGLLEVPGEWGMKGEWFDLKDFAYQEEDINDRKIKLKAKWTPNQE